MRKRPSKRRMKARLLLGREISKEDILNHRLDDFIKRHDIKMDRDFLREYYWRRA